MPFTLLHSTFSKGNALYFDEVQLNNYWIISFYCSMFCVLSKQYLLILGHKDFSCAVFQNVCSLAFKVISVTYFVWKGNGRVLFVLCMQVSKSPYWMSSALLMRISWPCWNISISKIVIQTHLLIWATLLQYYTTLIK